MKTSFVLASALLCGALSAGASAAALTAPIESTLIQNLGCPWSFDETLSAVQTNFTRGTIPSYNARNLERTRQLLRELQPSLSDNSVSTLAAKIDRLNKNISTALWHEFKTFAKTQTTEVPDFQDYISQNEKQTPRLVIFAESLSKIDTAFLQAEGTCADRLRLQDEMRALQTPADQPATLAALDGTFLHKFSLWEDGEGSLFSETSTPRLIKGALNVMSHLYQNCAVLKQPTLSATLSVEGIVITGAHSGGVGQKREIEFKNSLPVPQFYTSHPYLKDFATYFENEGRKKGCFDLTKNAPIYDFGGKPAWRNGKLELFINSGSGTSALGMDCSGFVFAAAMASGQRLIKSKANDPADLLMNYGAGALRQPTQNGLTCLSPYVIETPAQGTTQLRAGDIMATSGHVVMIEWVGPDPFGIAKLSSVADCVPEKFDSTTFAVRIIHSSSANNGIGVARHTLAGFSRPTMSAGFVEFAVKSCRAYFDKSFKTTSNLAAGANIVRPSADEACKDSRVKMSYDECVSQCQFKEF